MMPVPPCPPITTKEEYGVARAVFVFAVFALSVTQPGKEQDEIKATLKELDRAISAAPFDVVDDEIVAVDPATKKAKPAPELVGATS